MSVLKRILRHLALNHGRCVGLWRRIARPAGHDWACYLKRHGGLFAMGDDCVIQSNVTISDPAYVRLGHNVHLTGCTLFGHDGVVNMLKQAYGLELLDKVGPIDIGDHVFVGHQAIVMPGVRIGERCVVAAGALVTRDVPAGSIVGGCPARIIGQVDALFERLARETTTLPWAELLRQRGNHLAPANPELNAARVGYFFADIPVNGGSHG